MMYIPFLGWVLNVSNCTVVVWANFMVQSTILITVGLAIAYALKGKGPAVQSFIFRVFLVAFLITPLVSYISQRIGWKGITYIVPFERVNNDRVHKQPIDNQQSHRVSTVAETLTPYVKSQKEAITEKLPYFAFHHEDKQKELANTITVNTIQKKHNKLSISPLRHFSNKIFSPESLLNIRGISYIAITFLWIFLSAFYIGKFSLYFLRVAYLRRIAHPGKPSDIEECNVLSRIMGVKPPLILRSPHVKSPFLAGLSKPTIFLPENFDMTREIFIHELAHLVRRDFVWCLASYIGIAMLPFQPLMRILRRSIEDTSDFVCDAYVMKYNSNPTSFANQLLTLAVYYRPLSPEITTGVGIISFKSSLRQRIELILDKTNAYSLQVNVRSELLFIWFCICSTWIAGFIGFEGKNIIPKGNASEIFLKPLSTVTHVINHIPTLKSQFSLVSELPGIMTQSHRDIQPSSQPPSINHDERISGNEISSAADLSSPEMKMNSSSMLSQVSNCLDNGMPISSNDGLIVSSIEMNHSIIGIENGESLTPAETNPLYTASFEITALGTKGTFSSYGINDIPTGPVNIMVNFDFHNPGYSLSDDDITQQSGLYQGLDNYKSDPVWSPDGRLLAFTDVNYGIWIVSPEGGEPTLIYENKQAYPIASFGSLCFTPDGRELTFKRLTYDQKLGSIIQSEKNENGEVSVRYLNEIPVIESVNIYTGDHRVLVKEGSNCSWSHSGRYLCYINFDHRIYLNPSEATHHNVPVLYDTVTGESHILYDQQAAYGQPTFSPDDSHIVVPIEDTSGTTQLYKIPISGGTPEQLTIYDEHLTNGKTRLNPDYSPDGQWILYTDISGDSETPKNRLYAYNTSTGKTSRLFEDVEFNNGYGKWSPDGNYICYVMENNEPKKLIYISKFNPSNYINTGTDQSSEPLSFRIRGNYPNPFNPSTTIEFSLPASGSVNLVIYNIMGQKIRELVHETMDAGVHSAVWDGRDENGMHVSSGVYFSRLQMGNRVVSHKMTVMK